MNTYEFALVVSGIDVLAQDNDAALAAVGCHDATVLSLGGETHVVFYREAPSPHHAVRTAVSQVEAAFPDALICRLDRDLVAVPDIAERTGRTRQAVSLWVSGARAKGGFPSPQGVIGDGIRVWDWASVHHWLMRSSLDVELEDDAFPIPSDVAVALQYEIQTHTRRVQPAPEIAPLPHPTQRGVSIWTDLTLTGGWKASDAQGLYSLALRELRRHTGDIVITNTKAEHQIRVTGKREL